uniref:Fibronectin type-III domain-containing protein n=1 Tax=Amphimedon queenslandica TaxID=400682 RepID=A0A1X7T233_AMPQE
MKQFILDQLSTLANIDFSIVNCSTIDITWTAPTVDDRVTIQYYILRVYDSMTSNLVDIVSVYDTSYQFVDNNLFDHHYTYVITGVSKLGEGISNNNTFSYQRVPRLAVETDFMVNYTQNQTVTVSTVYYKISVNCNREY